MKKERLVQILKDCGAIKFGHFILTSGVVSNYYIDIKLASTNPTVLREIANRIKKYTEGYDLIAGMELGAVPIAVALSLETDIPYVIVRKEKKKHGTGSRIEGESVKGKNVLIVEDVTTSGGSVLKAISVLKSEGASLDKVVTVVDRESGAGDKIEETGLEFIPLISVSELVSSRT